MGFVCHIVFWRSHQFPSEEDFVYMVIETKKKLMANIYIEKLYKIHLMSRQKTLQKVGVGKVWF